MRKNGKGGRGEMRLIDADAIQIPSTYVDMFENCRNCKLLDEEQVREIINSAPTIDIVRCKECKHRPIKEDADGANYGFNLIEPIEGDDRCPCLVNDGWYSWMPKDDFYCGYGERRTDE